MDSGSTSTYLHRMEFDWKLFATAVGLAFVLEGLCYFSFAEHMPRILRALSERPPSDLRKLGLATLLLGLLILAFLRL